MNKMTRRFQSLCQELEKQNYLYTGQYIESVDGYTYFRTEWSEYVTHVKFHASNEKIVLHEVMCEEMSSFVLEAVEKEIQEILEKSILTVNNKLEKVA